MSLEDLSPDAVNELAFLARRLAESPETRKDFLRLTKRVTPNMPIPEIEIEESTNKVLQAAELRVQQLESKLQEKEAREELERRRQALVKRGKVSDESEIEEVEKIMLEKGITSHETAADYHKWMREAAAPTPTAFNMNVIDQKARDTLQAYWKNPQRAARDEAFKALHELRKNPRPIGL